eukprot:tig00000655_g2861.t1
MRSGAVREGEGEGCEKEDEVEPKQEPECRPIETSCLKPSCEMAENSDSTTLFVAELPHGMSEDAFQQQVNSLPGYVSSRLRSDRNGSLVGFIEFRDRGSAEHAKDKLDGTRLENAAKPLDILRAAPPTRLSGPPARPKRGRDDETDDRRERRRSRSPPGRGRDAFFPPPMPGYPSFMDPGFFPGPAAYPFMAGAPMGLGMPLVDPREVPMEATKTLYVQGVPGDATEREIAHIFRPFAGYLSVRLLERKSGQGKYGFVEFEDRVQAFIALRSSQGYRMDRNDNEGLYISFARSERRAGDRDR